MDVALIRWPGEEEKRLELANLQKPRLLLVDPGVDPPVCSDAHEDWVRLPVSKIDTRARVKGLLARVAVLESQAPSLGMYGGLEYQLARVQLSPLHARIIEPLVERFGAVVSREEMSDSGWRGEVPSQNTLDVNIARLRRQVRVVGLTVRTVRSRGYMLCPADGECDR